MPNELFKDLSNEEFEKRFYMEKTPENVNWMYACHQLDECTCGTDDLVGLLKELDDNYSGPINIQEDWGGCSATSNKELITEKLVFDLQENVFAHNREAILEVFRLGWNFYYDLEEYEEYLAESEEYQTFQAELKAELAESKEKL